MWDRPDAQTIGLAPKKHKKKEDTANISIRIFWYITQPNKYLDESPAD